MLFPALPLLIIWIAFPLAAMPFFRKGTLPTLTSALTLTAGVLTLIAISLPPSLFTPGEPANLPLPESFLPGAQGQFLIGLTLWLFGAGGLVLMTGGLAKGGNAGLMRGLGALGLVLLHLAAAVQVLRFLIPLSATAAATASTTATDPESLQAVFERIAQADGAAALGFLAGNALILITAVLTILSRLRRS